MLSIDEIRDLRHKCKRQIELRTKEAERGHDWVVDSHSFNSFQLLQLLALAELGVPVWMNQPESKKSEEPTP